LRQSVIDRGILLPKMLDLALKPMLRVLFATMLLNGPQKSKESRKEAMKKKARMRASSVAVVDLPYRKFARPEVNSM
jgi:hypothetical protein